MRLRACASTLRGHIVLAGVMSALVSLLGAHSCSTYWTTHTARPYACSHSVVPALRVVKGGCALWGVAKGFFATDPDERSFAYRGFSAPCACIVIRAASLSGGANRGAGRRRWMVIALAWMNIGCTCGRCARSGHHLIWWLGTLILGGFLRSSLLATGLRLTPMLNRVVGMALIGVRKF